MSRKNRLSTETYLKDAKALTRLFPNLAKYRRRKTLKPQEKAAITRALNIFEIVGDPKAPTVIKTRPERYRQYTFPANRKKKTKTYVTEARKLAEIGFDNFAKYKGRKKLKPSEKAAITRAKKKSRFLTEEVVRLPKSEARKLKKDIRFPVPGLNAIKLKNVEVPSKENKIKRRIKAEPYGLGVSIRFPGGNKRFYEFVYTGSDIDAMIDAAEELLDAGAKAVTVWLNHGASDNFKGNIEDFAAMIGDESALREVSARTGTAPDKIKSGGYAIAYAAADKNSDKHKTELAEVPWIWGVVGFFETSSKRKNPHPDYSL